MASLNQLADLVINKVNQPFNHELHQRVIDSLKASFATLIRRSTERHGIDNILTLSFVAELTQDIIPNLDLPMHQLPVGVNAFITKNKIPRVIRFHNDAPFTAVTDIYGMIYAYMPSNSVVRFSSHLMPTGNFRSYSLQNGYLIVNPINSLKEGNHDTEDRRVLDRIILTSIWESPEEVISFYQDIDGLDCDVPFPEDMIQQAISEVLKLEFNIYPKAVNVEINKDQNNSND